MREEIVQAILRHKLIAIVRGAEPDQLLPIAHALADGGVRLMEITFDQKHPENFSATTDGIRAVRRELGQRLYVGAGTVLTVDQAELAAQAGAAYLISPDSDPAVIRRTRELGLVSIPGAFTASEAKQAHQNGADFIKLFPCVGNGAEYLKALCAPLSHIRFLAVGGVDTQNASAFLKAGAVGLGVGGCLVNRKWVEAGEYSRITEEAKRMIQNISE